MCGWSGPDLFEENAPSVVRICVFDYLLVVLRDDYFTLLVVMFHPSMFLVV